MNAEIISIGTELLMGELVDTNSAFLASELAKIGVEVRWVTKVGDDPKLLQEVIERAWKRSDITLTSGGLGPTSDDLTRESIAAAFGEEMVVQEDLLEHLQGLFANRGFPMPETNIKQATLIPSAETIPNEHGTAPGWWAEKNGHVIVAMPGPPPGDSAHVGKHPCSQNQGSKPRRCHSHPQPEDLWHFGGRSGRDAVASVPER